MSARLSGLSTGKWPSTAKRVGYFAAAASATATQSLSQPGGWISPASTPAASISARHSSAVKCEAWRWCGGGEPLVQTWTCASTISMAFSPHSGAASRAAPSDTPRQSDGDANGAASAGHALGARRHVVESKRHRDAGVKAHQADDVGDALVAERLDRPVVQSLRHPARVAE